MEDDDEEEGPDEEDVDEGGESEHDEQVHLHPRKAAASDDISRRTFIYRLEPVLSGSTSCGRGDNYGPPCTEQGWGWFYADNDDLDEKTLRRAGKFSRSLASHRPHQVASVRTAREWIRRHGSEIFETIFNLPSIDMIHEDDLKDAIRMSAASAATASSTSSRGDGEILSEIRIQSTFEFVRIEVPEHEDYIDLVLRSKTPLLPQAQWLLDDPDVLHAVLRAMRREVWEGGDTWECGDFGNIPDGMENAAGGNGRIQITLSDPDSDWIQPRIPTDFRRQKECSASLYNDYGRIGTSSSGLSELGGVLVFAAFILALVRRYCWCHKEDDPNQ